MTKPDYCKNCNSENLVFIKDNKVFNPETDVENIIDTWVCNNCNTIHGIIEEHEFFDIDIDVNKSIQYTNDNNLKNWK